MKIDIAKDDLFPLMRILHDEYRRLAGTPAAQSSDPMFRCCVDPDIRLLAKVIRKLDSANIKCNGAASQVGTWMHLGHPSLSVDKSHKSTNSVLDTPTRGY